MLSAPDNSYFHMYLSLLSVLVNWNIGALVRVSSEPILIQLSLLISFAGLLSSYVCIMVSSNFFYFCLTVIPLTVGSSILSTCLSSLLTKSTHASSHAGAIFGFSDAIENLARVFAPLIGGIIMHYNELAILPFAASICFLLFGMHSLFAFCSTFKFSFV